MLLKVSIPPDSIKNHPDSMITLHLETKFQSHLDSIKTLYLPELVTTDELFQSHLDSIKTMQNNDNSLAGFMFQSHLDSIKTWWFLRCHKEGVCGFNPTLIRLKLTVTKVTFKTDRKFQSHLDSIKTIDDCRQANVLSCFNPTLIRLKPEDIVDIHFITIKFQSHLDSIKTQSATAHNQQRKPRFNPTLIRLKPHRYHRRHNYFRRGRNYRLNNRHPRCHHNNRFNPTLIRLKRGIGEPPGTLFSSFNPTLIRLKHGWLCRREL